MKVLLLLLLPFFAHSQDTIIYKNLALEGGGVRGIAYSGAFKALEQRGVLQHIEKVAGSSAGAIAGMMLAIGYSTEEMDSILMSLSFQKFNDGRWGVFGKYRRIKREFGIYKGDAYEEWLRNMLQSKFGNPDLTFRKLHEMKLEDGKYRDLYCTGTNISRQRLEVFSYETTPDFSIATAVRISGGIPLYFAPIALDDHLKKIEAGDTSFVNYYVDGGMMCNFPINMFDECENKSNPLLCDKVIFNKETLGLKLERSEQIDSFLHNFTTTIPPYQPKNFNQYLGAFANLSMETAERKYPGMENERGRTVYISYGTINPKIKKMSVKNKRLLYDNGIKAVERFFQPVTRNPITLN